MSTPRGRNRRACGLGRLVAAAILLAAGAAQSQPAPTSVAIDVSSLDDAAYERLDALELQQQVTLRLVQEGFAVVDVSADPDVRVEYRADPGLRIVAHTAGASRVRAVEVSPADDAANPDATDLGALHLEIAQKTVELVRQLPRPAPDQPAREPEVPEVRPPVTPAAPAAPAAPRTSLALVSGAVYRGHLDPTLGVSLEQPLSGPVALTGALDLSTSSSPQVDVLEWQLQAGLALTVARASHWELVLGARAGVLVHHFSVPDQSGVRRDWLVTAPVSLRRRVGASLSVGLRVVAGFTSRSRQHIRDGQQLWQRSGARIESLVELGWAP